MADPPAIVGRLSLIDGQVSLLPAGVDEWSDAYINRPITIGDRLWTADRSRAEVRIGPAAVRLDERTSADVLDLHYRYAQLRLGEGRMQLRIRSLPRDAAYEIDTPGGAVVIRSPGSYRIDVRPDVAETTVVVREGVAELTGSEASIDVQRGELVVFVNGGESYDYYAIGREDDFDRFAFARDARDDRRPTRYVSAEMTGYEDLDEYGTWTTASQYGPVWFPSRVDASWAPYRDGRWVWVEPWGWTWVDNAPWGFAPFHYGRWVRVRERWGWVPGDVQVQPVYAPALVAWVGGANFSVSATSAPVVGWFPLAYREPYIPWYETSTAYVREVNAPARVTNINVTNINVTQINYAYRRDPAAVTAVPTTVVVQAQPVSRAIVKLPEQRLAQAAMFTGATPVAPAAQSVGVKPAAARPPQAVVDRKVVALQAPPPPAPSFAARERAVQQHGGQPFKVQALAPAQPAGPAGRAPTPAAATPGTPAPVAKGPNAPGAPAATARAAIAPIQVIKSAPPKARGEGAPPSAVRAPGAPAPTPPAIAGAPIGKGVAGQAAPGATQAPAAQAPGARAPQETAKSAPEPPKSAESKKEPATARSAEAPKAPEAAAASARQAPTAAQQPPTAGAPESGKAEPKGPTAAPVARMPGSAGERAPPAAPPPSTERVAPPGAATRGVERALTTPESPTTRAGTPVPEERAAPRPTPNGGPRPPERPSSERVAPPSSERDKAPAPAPRAAERPAPAPPPRATPPAQGGERVVPPPPTAERAAPPQPPARTVTPERTPAPSATSPAPRAAPPAPPAAASAAPHPAPPPPHAGVPAAPSPPPATSPPARQGPPERAAAPPGARGTDKGPPPGKGPPPEKEKGKGRDERPQEAPGG